MNESSPKSAPTRKRYNILTLIFLCVIINYLDRTNISVAAPAICKELDLDNIQKGILLSAFSWTYAALQIPGGLMADLVRPRLLYSVLLVFWSIATLLQSFVHSLGALVGIRMGIGVFESPSYPMNNRIVTKWFPDHERASAIAIYTSGQFLGLAFLAPVLFAIQAYLGWRGLLFISGVIGIVFSFVWYKFYRDPQDHPTVNDEEIELIRSGGGLADKTDEGGNAEVKKFQWSELRYAFIYRKLWGVYIGQFCIGATFVFFLTWFPSYLVEYRGLSFIKSGFLASVPYIAAFFGVLLSGFTSDYLLKKGKSLGFSRKVPVLIGSLLSMCIVGANYTDSNAMVIVFLSIAFFGNGLASIAWVFISTMAPKHLLGLTGGVFNCIGGLSAITIPILIGFLAKDGEFEKALLFIASLALLGFLSFIFLVGKVERIETEIK